MITIPHRSLLDAIETINALNLTIGRDCTLQTATYALEIAPDAIDRLLQADLTPLPPICENSRIPDRIDREIELQGQHVLTAASIESNFAAAWENATTDADCQNAIRSRNLARYALRHRVIHSIVASDIVPGETIVYGAAFPGAQYLGTPDGISRRIDTLIHFTHPATPEELYLRECSIDARRIVRYYLPGLEDGIWMRQNEPRRSLNASGWRELLTERLQAQNGILSAAEK